VDFTLKGDIVLQVQRFKDVTFKLSLPCEGVPCRILVLNYCVLDCVYQDDKLDQTGVAA